MSIQQNINQLLGQAGMMAGIAKRVYQESPAGQAKAAEARQQAQEKQDQAALSNLNELYSQSQETAAKGLSGKEADIFFGVEDAPLEEKQEIMKKIAMTEEGNVSLSNMRDLLTNEIALRSKRLGYTSDPYDELRKLEETQAARRMFDKMSRQVMTKQEFKDFYESLDGGDN